MKRLFISLPDPLPESLEALDWRMPGAVQPSNLPECGRAANASALPAADEIWLALPAGRVLLSSVKLTKRALRQLNGALGNVLEDRLMLDPAQVHVALGKTLADDVHPVAVIECAWLEQALVLCRQQGIEPFGAIPETLLWEAGDAPEQWSARWRGHDGFVRSGSCSGFALDDGTLDTPPLALQLAVAEARRHGEGVVANTMPNVIPTAIVVETDASIDAVAWSQCLNCSVQLRALRADPHPLAINLLQGPYASRRRGSSGWFSDLLRSQHASQYRLAAGLVVAALAVHVLGTLADWARLSWENRKLRAEMLQVYKDTFPQTQAIVDPSLQMQRQLADLRRARGFSEAGDFLHALSAVSGRVGEVNGLSYENKRLILQQPRSTDLDGLRGALATQGYQMKTAGEPGNQSVTVERSQL